MVEVDETEIGSPPRGRKESPEKMIVVGAVEVRLNAKTGKHYPGRIRLRYLPSGRSKLALLGFVVEIIEKRSVVVTDGLSTYTDVPLVGYTRSIESTSQGMKRDDVLRHFHLVISNLKAWLAGTHHGAVSGKHMQAYLNEYVYRFNRRGNVFAGFQRLLGIASKVHGPEYGQLYAEAGEPDGWEHPDPAGIVTSSRTPAT